MGGQLSMRARGDALQVVAVQRELIAEVHLVRVHDLRCSVKGAAVVWQLQTTALADPMGQAVPDQGQRPFADAPGQSGRWAPVDLVTV